MVQQPKSYTANQADILTALVNSGIQQLAPGGKARALCDAVADKITEKETREFSNLGATLLPFATGTDLDLIGEIYGVPRIQQSTATVDASDQIFRFFVRTGTFGSINAGQDITIPNNVQITTADSSGQVFLTQAVVLPADQNEQYFSAISLYSGSSSNAPSGVFSRHNFTNYADYRFGSLLVGNNSGIVGGRDQEDDDSYRYRIHLKLISTSGSNEDALRLKILEVPGIRDVVFDGKAGTFYCYVYAITPVASSSVLSMVQTALDQNAAFPLSGVAINPDLVGITLATTITLSSGSTLSDQSTAVIQATQAVQNYINNLKIGQTLVINDIADQIRSANSRIVDVGQPNQQIQEIYVWKSRADGSRYSRSLIANYTPVLGERLVVEDIANAISLSLA